MPSAKRETKRLRHTECACYFRILGVSGIPCFLEVVGNSVRHSLIAGAAILFFMGSLSSLSCLADESIHENDGHAHAVAETDGHDHLHSDHSHPHDLHPEMAPATSRTTIAIVLAAQCVLIVFASLTGGWLPRLVRLTHTRMQVMISFVGGLMLGIGLLHLLPHSVTQMGSIDRAVLWVLIGTISMFFLLRAFHFHHHEPPEVTRSDPHDLECPGDTGPECSGHTDHAAHSHQHGQGHLHKLSWTGVALGLSVHTLIDGAALGASVQADANHGLPFWILGLGTFLAIVLHKPLDAMSITSLMAAGNWRWQSQQFVNCGFALMCPLGAASFVLGVSRLAETQHTIVGCALAFAAGVFLCISMSDLLPELEFHAHDRFKLSAAILAGILIAYLIGFLEPAHVHAHESHGAVSTLFDSFG